MNTNQQENKKEKQFFVSLKLFLLIICKYDSISSANTIWAVNETLYSTVTNPRGDHTGRTVISLPYLRGVLTCSCVFID